MTSVYYLQREDKKQLYGNHSENVTVYLQYRSNDVLRVKVGVSEVLPLTHILHHPLAGILKIKCLGRNELEKLG